MELINLSAIWALIIGFGVMMYILMDGFDLGVGILYPFAPDEHARDVMMNSVAPIWDGNETWLVLGGAGLLAAFPLVYTILLPALYLGVFLMLAGLIFRGIAFEFRFKSRRNRHWWNRAFCWGSMVATFCQGVVVGAYIEGFEVANNVYVGGPFDWLTPFTVITGLALMAGYALLGATWTILKSEGHVQEWAYRITPKLLLLVLVGFAIISIWTPFVDDFVRERWFDHLTLFWVFPFLALVCAGLIWRSVAKRREGQPFVATMGLFLFTYLGLVASKWPYLIPPDITLWEAASAPESQLFLLLGVLFVIPVVLGYTAWSYWVFRGKVRGAGYH
ncbi:cytochrome d ubiquinol oxidase subunit II [Halomonas denitrificans]|uniref:cytochrome d ubiquinol oxidase subunit II n=1 Tax=Halomonas TaxID=2745 RepID=UPI001A8CB4B9|nr:MULTISPECIES: cytochrome d ubiquinol oxidase subunit II [Halomonas]MBN8411085.1 cytochrome d ubiquinol oxidase subunit II [Halomonas litopenaei]MBY5970532.1 cytochrome d ubiquinol oxidase subunit II [Halomonas denitrificans]MBY5986180.1 cytochrome d ubiquinol oxidase subunit II [Halomonas sp. DP5Y7-2]MBY6208321.1 cytochrome d ubiquinol oxidase subunit II [Halomonas sp. DP3Y7-2]MBY6229130.1 cytochrome d ubiquinol oxidase subunit II [Halomonas sp. DP3Y7-1]